MPNQYLQGADLTTFGAPNATTAQVVKASSIIDGYLSREEGLLYTADNLGNPLYMTGKSPDFTITLSSNISPGLAVSATVTGPVQSINYQGPVGIIDRIGSNTANAEPLVVTSVTKINNTMWTIIFKSVTYSHLSGATIDFGLLIQEEIDMPAGRPICKVSRWPVLNIFSGYGRYGYGRRNVTDNIVVNEYNLLASISAFGGPPIWEPWTPDPSMWDVQTGELWAPAGIMLSYYSQIRVYYIAGFTYTNLPNQVKQACANIINSFNDIGVNSAGIKTLQAGMSRIDRFSNTIIDSDTQKLLSPFRSRLYV